ncbi:MAG: hypothetical protein ABF449_01170 [Ethanoligenens sp.]
MHFLQFAGNTRAKELAAHAFDTGRIPHALLIDGPAGSGKRTFARILAQTAVCDGTGEKPCGMCRQCRNALALHHPDIIEVEGGKGPRSFPIDAVRQVRASAAVGPNDAARKVYILIHVQNMSEQAQNALLKLIEEPPAYALFLLICDSRFRVLPTVRSRCVEFSLGPVPEEEAVAALCAQDAELHEADAHAAVRMAGGLIGQAKQGLYDGSFAASRAFCETFASALIGSAPYAFLRLSGTLEKDAALCNAFLALLPLLFRDALALREGLATALSGCADQAGTLARTFTRTALFALEEEAVSTRDSLERYANKPLLLTSLFARLWQVKNAL